MGRKIQHADGIIDIEPYGDGRFTVSVNCTNPAVFMPVSSCETSYPLELIEQILVAKGIGFLCDEILRDESSAYVDELVRLGLLPYVGETEFTNKTILDFGCGSGASTMALCRLLPQVSIVGVELEEKYVRVSRMRQQHWGITNVKFIHSPEADHLPENIGMFDYVVLSSVYEHLLPHERKNLLPQLWRVLKPGGVFFLHGTPHRYSPIEGHTTGFPFINYLPDKAACCLARKFSRIDLRNQSWESLLRHGIRGGTVREIMGLLRSGGGHPDLLKPQHLGMRDRIDLWMPKASRISFSNRCFKFTAKVLQSLTGIVFAPWLTLAIKKKA